MHCERERKDKEKIRKRNKYNKKLRTDEDVGAVGRFGAKGPDTPGAENVPSVGVAKVLREGTPGHVRSNGSAVKVKAQRGVQRRAGNGKAAHTSGIQKERECERKRGISQYFV